MSTSLTLFTIVDTFQCTDSFCVLSLTWDRKDYSPIHDDDEEVQREVRPHGGIGTGWTKGNDVT